MITTQNKFVVEDCLGFKSQSFSLVILRCGYNFTDFIQLVENNCACILGTIYSKSIFINLTTRLMSE